MPHTRIDLTDDLRALIRLSRTDVAGISQRQAALAAGDMSEVWWRQIETGPNTHAMADTLAKMCYAVSVTPEQLRAIGQHDVADLVEQRLTLLTPEASPATDMETYLLGTPGLTQSQRKILVSVAFGLLDTNPAQQRRSKLSTGE